MSFHCPFVMVPRFSLTCIWYCWYITDKLIDSLTCESGRFSDETNGGQIIEENTDCNADLSFICQGTGMQVFIAWYWDTLKSIHISSTFTLCIYIYLRCSLSVSSFLCRAKRKRHLWNGTALYTHYRKSNQFFHCIYLFVRILLLLHTWHCSINTIYVHCRQIYILFVPVRDPLIFQFLKLVRIFFVFPNNMYIVYVYIH